MSMIEKLSIQGIRSFGPDDPNKQVITFFTPLTLILGPNGTGKTTIIECLRYMTSGCSPPGAKGAAFIHDPKVANEREVKGQIRLQLRDVTNQQCIVQRSMTATQKVKKVECRTLEGVITRRGPDGEKKSISSKCAEIDREMVSALGVSKAVLDNVIFCHQEEANWPLSEGKALKEKFDAIFASTRYTKVLETIRKLKQEQDHNIKVFREEIKYLKQHRDKASELESSLTEYEAKLAASKETVDNFNAKLKPIEDKLQQIETKANEIHQISLKKEKVSSDMHHLMRSIDELKENIKNDFTGSTAELKKTLSEFESKVAATKTQLVELEKQKEDLTCELEQLENERTQLLLEVGKLQQEAENRDNSVKKRDDKIHKLATEYQFEGLDTGEITPDKYRRFFVNMNNKLETLSNNTKDLKVKYEKKESIIQRKIEELQESNTKLKQKIDMKKDNMKKNSSEIYNINQKLSRMKSSVRRFDNVNQDLILAVDDLEKTERSVNTEEIKKEITEKDKEKRRFENTLSDLNSELNQLHRQSNAQTELDMLKKDKLSKSENVERLKAKHEDTITYLLGHMPEHNIRGKIEEYMGQQHVQVNACSTELQKLKEKCSAKEQEKSMLSEQIKSYERKLREMEESLNNVCDSESFDTELTTVEIKLNQAQDTKGSLMGAEHFFKKYVKDLEKEKPFCPLCHRGFNDDQEVRELILELKQKLQLVPTQLEKAHMELNESKTKYDKMMELKPVKKNIAILQDTELPNLRKKYQQVTSEIQTLKQSIENKDEEYQTKYENSQMAKSLHSDIVLMDRFCGEIRELDKKISTQQELLPVSDSERTLEIVIQEKDDIQLKLDTLSKQLDRYRQRLTDHQDRVQQLRIKVNDLKEEKLKIEGELQEKTKLEETKTTLASENSALRSEIEETEKELEPLESQIAKEKTEKNKITKEKEEKIDEAKEEEELVRGNGNDVKIVNQNIKHYDQSGKAERLNRSKDRQKTLMSELAEKEQQCGEITGKINSLNKELANQQIRQRELNDIDQLRKKEKDVKSLQVEKEQLQQQLAGFDVNNLERERRKLLENSGKLQKERNIAIGRQEGYEGQIRTTRKDLQTDMFKDAKEKYREKMIEMQTTELANDDLQKYYTAMDRAIMNYHNQKMNEINKIIRELWRNTYRGHDIETIEIRSDEDDSGIMKSRRSYNYRVVMVKGDAVLDMRGRCSAGQKVLASLIIRLALAETFCVSCGILALDEPTTNLDRENIESLAFALVEIIKTRSQQKNFQLLVITHDEDFVELLGRSDFVDEFYKVRKNTDGYSQIVRAMVKDLHTR